MSNRKPTPVPDRIEDRVYYEMTVRIEGAPMPTTEMSIDEAYAMAHAVAAAVGKAFRDRWSSAHAEKAPAPIGASV